MMIVGVIPTEGTTGIIECVDDAESGDSLDRPSGVYDGPGVLGSR
jgi:hypothetical protein